ncbi:MAG: LysR family transcriptional regulator [Thaumarchaeota archaeon]|nr:LysR family transcriptional regulator [Nitrososphaerota archaeon]
MEKLEPKFHVWLERDSQRIIGKNEAQILEGIRKLGSFMAASKSLGISYAYAWNTIDNVEKIIGKTLVEAKKGGEHGGGARLTEEGLQILRQFHELEERTQRFLSGSDFSHTRQDVFETKVKLPDFTVIGSDCVGIDILTKMMLKEKEFTYDIVRVGSSGGLSAIMLGEADVAGVHLFDEETGEYNIPFLKKFWIADRAVLIRGYVRELGFIVNKGNPKKILQVSDLLRKDVRIVNRTLGSGTRTLLDTFLRKEVEKRGLRFKETVSKIKGYSVEVKSHVDVAKAVLDGEADAGFGIRNAAKTGELNFAPLIRENFDFVAEERRLKKSFLQLFMTKLASREFESRAKVSGLQVLKETGSIIYKP